MAAFLFEKLLFEKLCRPEIGCLKKSNDLITLALKLKFSNKRPQTDKQVIVLPRLLILTTQILLLSICIGSSAFADERQKMVRQEVVRQAGGLEKSMLAEGEHYQLLPAGLIATQSDVTELVDFRSRRSYRLSPRLTDWAAKLPTNVRFSKVPLIVDARSELYARGYYAAMELQLSERIKPRLFDAIAARRQMINTERELAQLFAVEGVSRQRFSQAFHSLSVSSQTLRAKQLSQQLRRQVGAVQAPELLIAGRYRVSLQSVASGDVVDLEALERLTTVANYLLLEPQAVIADTRPAPDNQITN